MSQPTEPTEPTESTEPRSESDKPDILSHLQAAAKELIAAGRAALDVADEVASDGIRLLGGFMARAQQAPTASPKVERIDVQVDPQPPEEGKGSPF